MSEIQKELRLQFRQQQEKFVYYIIALSVSAIAFSIYRTNGEHLKFTQIPLALAVLSWGISIYCGISFLKYSISILYNNNTYYEIKFDQTENPELKNIKLEAMKEGILESVETSSRYFKWQGRLFYSGMILFIVWHITEMYFNSCCGK
jgi:hypothetical protein